MKPTAVVGRRVGAFVLDSLLLTAINAALFFPLADTGEEIVRKLQAGEIDANATTYVNLTLGDKQYSILGGSAALYFLLVFVIAVGYWVVLQGRTGATVGKALTGIRVVRKDGSSPPGIGRSLVRQLLWVVDAFPYVLPYLTGFVTALATPRNTRIGDLVGGTLVVRKQFAGEAAEPAPQGAPHPAPDVPGPVPETPAQPAPDWYPDPKGEKRLRYWDGSAWTTHTAD